MASVREHFRNGHWGLHKLVKVPRLLSTQPQMGQFVTPSNVHGTLYKGGGKNESAGGNRRGIRTWVYILGSMCLLCSLYSCFDYMHKIGLLNTVGEGGVHDVPVLLEEFTQFMVVGERCFLQWYNSRFCKQPPSSPWWLQLSLFLHHLLQSSTESRWFRPLGPTPQRRVEMEPNGRSLTVSF